MTVPCSARTDIASCVTQSAVSRQIQLPEEQTGVSLFGRRTRAVVLTEAGYLYYMEVQRLLRELQDATRKVMAARAAQRLRVSTTLTFASIWPVPRLADFQAKHPHIQVHAIAGNALCDLARDDFDLAIRYSPRAMAQPGGVKLFDKKLSPVCSPTLLARRPPSRSRIARTGPRLRDNAQRSAAA